jgi:hypothetical protein
MYNNVILVPGSCHALILEEELVNFHNEIITLRTIISPDAAVSVGNGLENDRLSAVDVETLKSLGAKTLPVTEHHLKC